MIDPPEAMKKLPQWVFYNDKKVPINPKTLGFADTTNPKTWVNFKTLEAIFNESDVQEKVVGIGFVFTKGDNLMGVDLDGAILDGKITGVAKKILDSSDTYAEVSPSGKGLHIIFQKPYPSLKGVRNKFVINGQDVEVYEHSRYFTFTGKRLKKSNAEVTSNGCEFIIAEFNKKIGYTIKEANVSSATLTDDISSRRFPFGMFDVKRIEDALSSLDGTSEPEWYNRYTRSIASAAVENPDFEEQLKGVWDDWSQNFDNYDQDKNFRKWELAKTQTRDVTLGTLIHDAKENGWVGQDSYSDVDEGKGCITHYQAPWVNRFRDGELDISIPDDDEDDKKVELWDYITAKTIETAIKGSYLDDVCDCMRSIMENNDDKPLPISMVFGKALAVCGAALAGPVDTYNCDIENTEPLREKGIDLSKFKFCSGGGLTTNIYSLLLAPSGIGKDIGNMDARIAYDKFIAFGSMSYEGFLDALKEKGAGIWRISEFEPFLSVNSNDYKSKCKDILLVTFNQGFYSARYSKKNKGSSDRVIDYIYPSVIASLQPEVFKKMARGAAHVSSGFLQRFLITHCDDDKSGYRPASPPKELVDRAVRAVKHFEELRGEVPAPRRYLNGLFTEFEKSSGIKSIYGRLINEYGPKIACILQADAKEITDDTWNRTAWIIKWLYAQAHTFLPDLSLDEKSALIDEKVSKIYQAILLNNGPMARTKLIKKNNAFRTSSPDEKDRYIRTMLECGLISIVDKKYVAVETNAKKIEWKEKIFNPIEKYVIPGSDSDSLGLPGEATDFEGDLFKEEPRELTNDEVFDGKKVVKEEDLKFDPDYEEGDIFK